MPSLSPLAEPALEAPPAWGLDAGEGSARLQAGKLRAVAALSPAVRPTPRRVVILGIGNTILSDEGVGVHAALALLARYALPEGVEVIDGGTAGMELLDALADADLLLVLDAIKAHRRPGSVVCLRGPEVPVFFRSKLSPHQVSICDVLASLEFAGHAPRDLVLIGVEPLSLELGLEMTPTVAHSLPEMLRLAIAELAARGLPLTPLHAQGM